MCVTIYSENSRRHTIHHTLHAQREKRERERDKHTQEENLTGRGGDAYAALAVMLYRNLRGQSSASPSSRTSCIPIHLR